MQENVPATGIARCKVGELVDLHHVRDGAFQERSVVTDDHAASAHVGDEPLQPGEPLEVEVVGRLVEQEHVEPREEERRETNASSFATGEHRQPLVQQSLGQAEVGPHIGHARIKVGRTQRQPPVECIAVLVACVGIASGHRCSRGIQCGGRCGDARSSFQVLAHGLVRTLWLLRQIADVGRGRRECDRATVSMQ